MKLTGLAKTRYKYLTDVCRLTFPLSLHVLVKMRNIGRNSIAAFEKAKLIQYDDEDRELAREEIIALEKQFEKSKELFLRTKKRIRIQMCRLRKIEKSGNSKSSCQKIKRNGNGAI